MFVLVVNRKTSKSNFKVFCFFRAILSHLVYNMSIEFFLSKSEILNEIKILMRDEKIRPEAEYQFFSKYLAASKKKKFIQDEEEEILHLINAHGVNVRNDVKYWLDKSKVDNLGEDIKKQVPVLNPEHFQVQDYNDLIKKLKELPSEWTILQITKKFSLCDVTRKEEFPELQLTKFACGDLVERLHPYSVTVEKNNNSHENIFKILENLTKMRKDYYNFDRTCKKMYEAFYKTNSDLENFIKELHLYVLGPWICLFQGRLEDLSLEKKTFEHIRKLVNAFCEKEEMKMPNEKQIDVVYNLALAAHLLKNKTIFSALRSVLYTSDSNLVNVSELMMLVENIKMLNISNSCALKRAKQKPIILIMDNEFEMVPWEMIATLSGQPVCRISCLHLLYALYKYHEPHIKNGFRIVEVDSTYCLINPGQDLKECEKEMKEFLKERIPWAEVEIGKAPDSKVLLSKIEDYTTYLYCGHGSGTQYLKSKDLKKAFVRGLLMLFGCSSNIPKNCGGRTPYQNQTYTYISNGCPCIIGCIQDLGSTDADAVCKKLLSNIMPVFVVEGARKFFSAPKEPDVLKSLAVERLVCSKYWSKSAFVARGIPCKTAAGDIKEVT